MIGPQAKPRGTGDANPGHGTTAQYHRERKLGEICSACREANASYQRGRRAKAKADAPSPWLEPPLGRETIVFLSAAPASGSRWNIEIAALADREEMWLMFGAVEDLQTHQVLGRVLDLVREYRVKVALLHHEDLVFLTTRYDQTFANKIADLGAKVCHINADVDPEDLREGAKATLHAVDDALRHQPTNNPYVETKRAQLELGAPGLDHLLADALATQNLPMVRLTARVHTSRQELEAEQAGGHRVAGARVARGRMLETGRFVQQDPEYDPLPADHPAARNESWIVTRGGG